MPAAPADQRVDFADEEAALAARDAGLELGEETPEAEDEAPAAGASDLYAGKERPGLVELFARQRGAARAVAAPRGGRR